MADLRQLTRTFVDLADTLVDEFDVIELLHVLTSRCVDLLGVDAAGVMLADSHGQLRLAAASSERARLLELIELQNDEGPCLDAFRTGRQVSYVDVGHRGGARGRCSPRTPRLRASPRSTPCR